MGLMEVSFNEDKMNEEVFLRMGAEIGAYLEKLGIVISRKSNQGPTDGIEDHGNRLAVMYKPKTGSKGAHPSTVILIDHYEFSPTYMQVIVNSDKKEEASRISSEIRDIVEKNYGQYVDTHPWGEKDMNCFGF